MATFRTLYYDPAKPRAFSTQKKLGVAVTKKKKKKKKLGDISALLEKEDAYTLHRSIRKRYPRKPYTVKKVMFFWGMCPGQRPGSR